MPLIFNYRSIVLLNTVVLLHFVRRRQISLLNLLVIPLGRSSRLARFTQSAHLKRRRGSAVVFYEKRDKGGYDGYARHEDPPEITSEDILVDRECVDLERVIKGMLVSLKDLEGRGKTHRADQPWSDDSA